MDKVFVSVSHVQKRNARGLRKKVRVLEDVSFELRLGCVTGLLGASGSGKSTLARLLLGLEKPDGGRILIEGQELRAWRAANRGGMAVVFQDYVTSVNPAFTVEECVAEGLEACGKRNGEDSPCVAELLARVGLAESLADRRCLELSGGQIQRVCLARAFASRPRLLVLDEALSSLDVSLQAGMAELLRGQAKDMACLFITHDIQLASLICERILVLDQGKITDNVATEALFAESGVHLSPALREMLDCTMVFCSRFEDEGHGA